MERHHARNAQMFGSVLHGEDTEHSDLDLLVDPTPKTTLMDIAAIQVETEDGNIYQMDEHFIEQHTELPWKVMRAMRNRVTPWLFRD